MFLLYHLITHIVLYILSVFLYLLTGFPEKSQKA